MNQDILDKVVSSSVFSEIPLERKTIEKYNFQLCHYSSGEIIFHEEDVVSKIGLLVSGVLKTTLYSDSGDEKQGQYFLPGDIFPIYLSFAKDATYLYNLVTYKRAEVIWISIKEFIEMINSNKDILYCVFKFECSRGLIQALRIRALTYNTIRERLAYWLVQNIHTGNLDYYTIPYSQQVLADLLCVSRSALNQQIKKMEEEKLFKVQGKKLINIDTLQLSKIY